jgi:hypothetical protein
VIRIILRVQIQSRVEMETRCMFGSEVEREDVVRGGRWYSPACNAAGSLEN